MQLVFLQSFLVQSCRKLELLPSDSQFLRIDMVIKVLFFCVMVLIIKKLKWLEGKSRKGKTIALKFFE